MENNLMGKFEERLAGLSPEQRELVRQLLKQENIDVGDLLGGDTYPGDCGIAAAEARDVYPLSSAQKRLYILDRIGDAGDAYHIRDIRPLDHFPGKEKIESVFGALIRRHESLRTSFHVVDGEPVQRIHDPDHIEFPLMVIDQSNEPEHGDALSKTVTTMIRPFRLTEAPLFRSCVILLPQRKAILVTVMHHIVSDGTSMSILFEEFQRLFSGDTLQSISLTYKDYAVWQQARAKDGELENQRRFWLDEFSGLEPMNPLPSDSPRPLEQDYTGGSATSRLTHNELAALERFATANGATLNMVMLSGLVILLHRLGCGNDIVVGVPVAGRNHELLQNIVGMFVNTVALRIGIRESASLKDLLEAVKRNHINALENQDFPFEDLVDALELPRDTGRNPLFDVMFAWQEVSGDRAADAPALTVELQQLSSRFDMTWNVFPHANGLEIEVEYAGSLFLPSSIQRFGDCFRKICLSLANHPDLPIGNLDIVSDTEREAILHSFNNTGSEVPDETIVHVFLRKALQHPGATALIAGETSLSYGELHHRACALALSLHKAGTGAHHIVGIMMHRSPELMIGILGTLLCGASYLPIEPGYPPERIAFIKNDSRMKLCLDAGFVAKAGETGEISDIEFDALKPTPEDLAYIIYTSGSTGTPKGVAVRHCSIFNRLYWLQRSYPLHPGDVILQKTTIVFDVSVGELLGWIIGGAALCMLAPGGHTDLPLLVKEIRRRRISAIHFVPSMMKVFLDYVEERNLINSLRSLQQVWSSGEALDIHTVKRFRRIFSGLDTRLLNLYGPTEAAVEVSYFDCRDIDNFHSVPIGRPIDNVCLAIVNRRFRLCPIGVPGEILIGGIAVAEGYLNRPELTAERFVDSPVPGFPKRAYRSGDLGRFLADGTIQYLGRIDRQLKLRGFRIEPGEIRQRILRFGGISDAVVVLAGEKDEQQLCGYIAASTPPDFDTLRKYLSLHLPAYMVPSHLMAIDTIPLTENGKLDKAALPQPDRGGETIFEAPVNNMERTMAALWAGVLGVEEYEIGRGSNFFSLGGNSLKAMKLCAVIKRDMGISPTLVDFFRAPTVGGLVSMYSDMAPKSATVIQPIEKMDYYPVSPAQKRLVILQYLEPDSAVYNIPLMVRLDGAVSLESMQHTFRRLILRHESLRTSFTWVDDVPVQRVHTHCSFAVEDLALLEEGDEENLKKLYLSFIRPFDLASPPLFRGGIIRYRGEGGLLLLDIHHSVSDGLSLEILQREFLELYNGGHLAPLSIQYKDYALWQASRLVRRERADQESYWLDRFGDGVPLLELPTDFPRPDIQSFDGDVVAFSLDNRLVGELEGIANSLGATIYMMLLSVCSILMAKLTGQEDVVLGTVMAGRRHADLEGLVGMFVNTLPLRIFPRRDTTVDSFFREVVKDTLEAFDHQDVPFEVLVERLDIVRDAGRNPVFDVMLAYQEADDQGAGFVHPVSRFDMSWTLAPSDGGLSGTLEYSTALFRRQTAERFTQCFVHVAREMAAKPDTCLCRLDIVPPKERERLIQSFNQTGFEYPDATIDGLFNAQVERTPDSVALVFSDESVTYRELQLRSNSTALALIDSGAKPGGLVGMVMERSIELVVGILGILKSGNGYVPIDPAYPPDRIQYILQDSGIAMIVFDRTADSGEFGKRKPLVLPGASRPRAGSLLRRGADAEAVAYVIYTSGTTGNPKGVAIQHRSVVNLAWYQMRRFSIEADERILQFSSYCFDASVEQLWIALLSGASSVLLPDPVMQAMELFNQYILTRMVSHIHAVPSFLALLDLPAGNTVKRVVSGGDTCPPKLAAKFAHSYTFFNEYGPTETTVTSIEARVESMAEEDVVIGKPIGNTQVAILGFDHSLLPFGLVGELAIGGEGVGQGYLNRPELTAERFIDDRLFGGKKLYLTGDLCRWQEDGQLEFLGRRDNQVKIRGFRIELGEIENQLLAHENVSQAAVVCRDAAGGDRMLAAYVVADGNDELLIQLEDALRKKLPTYMVPAVFTRMDALPLNANGKVDQKALPQPGVAANVEHTQPAGALDEGLLSIWSEVLGMEPSIIYADSDFFKLGGHSLKAMVLANRVKRDYGVDLPLVEIFRNSLFREQSAKISSLRNQTPVSLTPREKLDYYPLSGVQRRLYIEWQMDRIGVAYNIPLVIRLGNGIEENEIERIMTLLVRRHESLRTYIEEVDGEPMQRIAEEPDFQIRSLGDVSGKGELRQVLNGFVRPFDLASAPLLRCALVRVGGELTLLLDVHHIVGDGASIQILEHEFIALANREALPPLPIQYRDFAMWQREMEQIGLHHQESFWLKELEGDLPTIRLPEDFPRPRTRSFDGQMVSFMLDVHVASALRRICSNYKVTMFMLMEAIAAILFARLSHLEDVVLGTAVRGRNQPELEGVVGMFVNTLPLRSFPQGDKPFGQFLKEVARHTLEAFDHQDVPFERLVEKLWISRDTSRHPLFDIMVELQEVAKLDLHNGEDERDDDSATQAAKFDITLVAVDNGELLEINWRYNRLLFKPETVVGFQKYFEAVINCIIADSVIPIMAIDLFSDTPHIGKIAIWPDGAERRIDQWFSDTAGQYPRRIAVVSADGGRRMNYQELDRASSRMARELKYRGLGQPTVVAVLMDASIEMIVAILGVLKAGASFLPLDPTTPASRVEYILKDSGAKFMISRSSIERRFAFDGELLPVDQNNRDYGDVKIERGAFKTADPAYIIYTSGTTGRPKGVVLSHNNLSLYTRWIIDEAAIGPDDRTMLLSSFAFDLGYTAVFSSLLSGGSLMVMDRDAYLSPEKVLRSIKDEKISYLKTTPSLFSTIIHSGYFSATHCASLRLWILGGEPINVNDVQHAHRMCGHIEFINHYGPTEATIGCVFHRIDTGNLQAYKERPVIGRPIHGMGASIVSPDHHRIPEPTGKQGELTVAGCGVALGYLNRPELTHQQFPEDGPWGGQRMYLTGDLAKRLPDGSIQLAGRIGNQVKIRGFRVELEEIEAQLRQCRGVMEAAVITRQIAGGRQLAAYLAPKENIDSETVKCQLKEYLPEYMIPPTMVLLDSLPLTANNKVDRKALPEPEFETGKIEEKPRDSIEQRLAALWASVLKRDVADIGIDRDFFEIGGQSLKAAILSSHIHKEFHVRVSLPDIFSSPNIREMAEFVRQADTHIHTGIAPVEKREYYPLSSAQTRLYILQQFDPNSTAYNRFRAVFLDPSTNLRRVRQTFDRLIQRHESFRTGFFMLDSRPVQKVHDTVPFSISRKRASNINDVIEPFVRPFELSEAPLLRAEIVELPADKHVLLVDMHHIIADGTSQDVMVRDFLRLYDGDSIDDLTLQYRDFAVWQNGDGFQRRVRDQEDYWLEQLFSPLPILDLPTDFPRPPIQRFEGRTVSLQLGPAVTYRLRGLLREAEVTLFMALLTVYYIWLFRLTGQEDIIAGVPVAGRPHHDLQEILGMFVNTLAIRGFPEGEAPFLQFLGNTRVRVLEAFDNQDVQFEDLVERLNVPRDAGRNPLFDASFNILNYLAIEKNTNSHNREEEDISYESRVAKFDINCTVIEEEDCLQILFQYSTQLFKEETIRRYINYFERLLLSILDTPQKSLKDLDMVSEAESRQILHQFNNPVQEKFDGNLCRLFLERERKHQHKVAVVYEGEALTYGQLGRRARRMALALKNRGVGDESIVALHMTRSVALIESILAILFSGGAYLPIDLELPVRRKAYMLADSQASIILAGKEDYISLPEECHEKVMIWEEIDDKDVDVFPIESQLAYIIYTSGTTGLPKGVMIERRGVANLVYALQKDIYGEFDDARVALVAPVHFDASVKQIFPAILGGHCLAVVPEKVKLDQEALTGYLRRHAIDISDCTPALLQLLLEGGEPDSPELPVAKWLIGGDVLDKITCRRLIRASEVSGTRIFNVYGPTECTDVSSYFEVMDESVRDERHIPVGKPLPNTKILIFDRFGNLQPPGIPGELAISGTGTGRGYLNQPELTFETFNDAGTRFYHTGDLARWRDDGNIEYLGRLDHQVKIRGYRIELQEIEHAILSLDGVSEALAAAHSGPGGDQRLLGYVVLENKGPEASLDCDAIRRHLGEFLPGYMIPGWIEILGAFPLTSNGKIDRAALPLPQEGIGITGLCPPVDDFERALLTMWAALLAIDEQTFGTNDDFFQLGGHSLKATILMSRIQKEFGVKIPLVELFRDPTIKGLACCVRAGIPKDYIQIHAAEKKDYYPLSPTQKRFYLLNQMIPDITAYNISHVVRLREDVRFDLLESALKGVIQRHEVFRSSFIAIGEQPVQRVHDSVDFTLQYLDDGEDIQSFVQPFNLSVAPLLRAAIYKSQAGVFLLVDCHHITGDGVSTAVLEEEILALYNGSGLEALELQYRDYAQWQQEPGQKDKIELSVGYWRDIFSGDVSVLNLPLDFPRPSVQNYAGQRLFFECSAQQSSMIEEWAQRNDATMFMAVLALFYVLLAHLSGQEDIVVGTPVAGRGHADLERMVGPFVNTLPLRGKPVGTKPLSGFLTEVKSDVVAALEHQQLPFEELVDRLDIPRDAGRNPLFDVMFAFHNIRDPQAGAFPDPLGDKHPLMERKHSRFDMTWSFSLHGNRLMGAVEYATALFKPDSVQRFVSFFNTIVDALSNEEDPALNRMELLTPDEKSRQLEAFNRTGKDIPEDLTLLDLFQKRLQENPGRISLSGPSIFQGSTTQLTYRALWTLASEVAHTLRTHHLQEGSIVPIVFRHCVEMVAATLGIMMAGGVFLPIDPDTPLERVSWMVADCGASILVTHRACAGLGELPIETIFLDEIAKTESPTESSQFTALNSESRAYLIYTSGTSGRPKGVLVGHRSLLNLCLWHRHAFSITGNDRASKLAGFGFDASVWEVFPYLAAGSSLVIVPEHLKLDPTSLNSYFERQQVTVAFLPTPLCEAFLELENTTLRVLQTGGDKLKRANPNQYQLFNNYGPTENTVVATSFAVEGDFVNIPIGKPVWNQSLYICDDYGNVQPVGIPGELWIAGTGLALGYLNQPELTSEFFVYSDVHGGGKELIYKTGDLCRWLPDGNIEFLGRKDNQVQIRGFRIEMAEIEHTLMRSGELKDVVLVCRRRDDGESYLVAYLVARDDVVEIEGLRQFLEGQLPNYMIPSFFIPLDSLPVTANGKIDRKRLPEQDLVWDSEHSKPNTSLELKLQRIWSGVLSIESDGIGLDSDFFALGGHSLKATVLAARINKELHVELKLVDIFQYPTIRSQASLIGSSAPQLFSRIHPLEERQYYHLSPAQKRLYILQQFNRQSTVYNIPMLIPIAPSLSEEQITTVFQTLIRRHESLRTSFVTVNNIPVQQVHATAHFYLERFLAPKDSGKTFLHDIFSKFVRPYDLAKPPLIRVGIVQEGEDRRFLLLDMHHIISDGASVEILEREFLALCGNQELPPLDIHYKDYAHWLQTGDMKARIKGQQLYWKDRFAGWNSGAVLPMDFPRPRQRRYSGQSVRFRLEDRVCKNLTLYSREYGLTTFMTILSCLAMVLSKLAGQEDVVIGTAVSGRRHADVELLVGMFVNTLALRHHPAGDTRLEEYTETVKQRTLEDFDHQDFPFEELVDGLRLDRNTGRNPLFDLMLAYRDMDGEGFDDSPVNIHGISRFDMSWNFYGSGERMMVSVEFSDELFRLETVERFIAYFSQIAGQLMESRHLPLKECDIVPAEEKKRLVERATGEESDIPALPLHELFRRKVLDGPGRTAVEINDSYLTYEELDRRSDILAAYLRRNGVGRGCLAALYLRRAIEMMVAILGILKSGAAYVPLDIDYPEERLEFIIKDCGAAALLVSEDIPSCASSLCELVDISNLNPVGAVGVKNETQAHDPAYVIYTSGTTGKPKGVVIEHRSVANLALYQARRFSLHDSERILQFSSYCFDASVEQIFITLFSGASLVLIHRGDILDIERFHRYIFNKQLTHIHAVPSFLALIDLSGIRSLKRVVAGGDICPPALVRYFTAFCDFYNEYGPTETTVTSIEARFAEDTASHSIPIGGPLGNTYAYILDQYGNLVPDGVIGELYIAGAGVGRGYINRPRLTGDAFLPDHIAGHGTMYRTGDFCRRNSEGAIEFLGRRDNQIKVRGFRIETGEIEHLLLEHELVNGALIIAGKNKAGEASLIGYLVLRPDVDATCLDELRLLMRERLPSYMIPSTLIPLDSFPLNANGKVDTSQLPAPGIEPQELDSELKTSLERSLRLIWSEILSLDESQIGRHSDFFSIGGHSLNATILAGRIHKILAVNLPLTEIFNHPTIGQLAELIADSTPERFAHIQPLEKQDYYRMSPSQTRLFFLQQLDRSSIVYNMPMAIPIGDSFQVEELKAAFLNLIRRHESLRTSFTTVNGRPVQRIHDNVELQIGKYSHQNIDAFIRPFDLTAAPLLRVGLADGFLLVDMHHIISDGVSLQVLEQEFMEIIQNRQLQPPSIQYKDYAAWCSTGEMRDQLARQQAYWLALYSDGAPGVELPLDYPRAKNPGFSGDVIRFAFDEPVYQGLVTLCRTYGITTFMALTAAFSILLSKLSGQEDVVLGTVVSGRRHIDVERMIGMFVNTLALRVKPLGETSLRDYIEIIRERLLEAFDNQDFPFEDLVDKLQPERKPGRNPLFDVMIEFHEGVETNEPEEPLMDHRVSRFDMSWTFVSYENGIRGSVEFSDELYQRGTIERFVHYLQKILSGIGSGGNPVLKDIDIFDNQERQWILEALGGEESAIPSQFPHQAFERQASLRGDHIAVELEDESLTYKELALISNRLAADLIQRGAGAGTLVAVCMERSLNMIAALLGILKSGSAYVPLDPAYPAERLEFVLKDSSSILTIISGPNHPLPGYESQFLHMDQVDDRMERPILDSDVDPHSPAYVIYTSGTTGRPKGVIVEHKSFANLVYSQIKNYKIDDTERIVQFSSFSFDASL
jgi:tyrocidine synthetase-3